MRFTSFIHWNYVHVLKPVFFLMDPEWTHELLTSVGKSLGRFSGTRWVTRKVFSFEHPMLEQKIMGIRFQNPIGLAAGFDKNGMLIDILPDVGFGFEEIGSLTAYPCKGNPKKRLWRLPKSRGLVVNYGLMNDGAKTICDRLKNKRFRIPIGISIARTNRQDCAPDSEGIKDYVSSVRCASDVGDYDVINISCPNSFGGLAFHRPDALDALLTEIERFPNNKPVLLKLSPDISKDDLRNIIEVSDRHRVSGFIVGNLTKDYYRPEIVQQEMKNQNITIGGISGKPTEQCSNELIAETYRLTKGQKVIIGCGGVFSAEDAYKKILLGANLVQLITGMIYEGPQLIGEINKGLVDLLKIDGYASVSEAVGKANVNFG